MKTKEQKLAQVYELVENLGLTRDEVVDYFTKLPSVKKPKKSQLPIDITQVEIGMFWYEDDTFSFDRITNKKIKAIVELVENGIIYGDLTASELFDILEMHLTWFKAKQFFDKFYYPCGENEKIVWYNINQLQSVYKNYNAVKETFSKLDKMYRRLEYWSSTEHKSSVNDSNTFALDINFNTGSRLVDHQYNCFYIRPVLALKVS